MCGLVVGRANSLLPRSEEQERREPAGKRAMLCWEAASPQPCPLAQILCGDVGSPPLPGHSVLCPEHYQDPRSFSNVAPERAAWLLGCGRDRRWRNRLQGAGSGTGNLGARREGRGQQEKTPSAKRPRAVPLRAATRPKFPLCSLRTCHVASGKSVGPSGPQILNVDDICLLAPHTDGRTKPSHVPADICYRYVRVYI